MVTKYAFLLHCCCCSRSPFLFVLQRAFGTRPGSVRQARVHIASVCCAGCGCSSCALDSNRHGPKSRANPYCSIGCRCGASSLAAHSSNSGLLFFKATSQCLLIEKLL